MRPHAQSNNFALHKLLSSFTSDTVDPRACLLLFLGLGGGGTDELEELLEDDELEELVTAEYIVVYPRDVVVAHCLGAGVAMVVLLGLIMQPMGIFLCAKIYLA